MFSSNKRTVSFIIAAVLLVSMLMSVHLTIVAESSDNLLLGATVTTSGDPRNATNPITNLTDGDVNNRGISYHGASWNTCVPTVTYDITLAEAQTMNKIVLYFSQHDTAMRAADIAVDVCVGKAWIRVAECHGIEFPASGAYNMTFAFETATVSVVRITSNMAANAKFGAATIFTAYGEVEAYYDAAVTEADYAVIERVDSAEATYIPYYDSANLLAGLTASTNGYWQSSSAATELTNGKTGYGNRGMVSSVSAGTVKSSYPTTLYIEYDLGAAVSINQVKLYYTLYEPKYRERDLAIDVYNKGVWTRVSELHDIEWTDVSDYTANGTGTTKVINFTAVTGSKLRITPNCAASYQYTVKGDSDTLRVYASYSEIEAYYVTSATATDDFVAEEDHVAADQPTHIPYYASDNVAPNSTVSANSPLSAFPIAQIIDGVKAASTDHNSSGITGYNATTGLAYYQLDFAQAQTLNTVDLYYNAVEANNRPFDMAVDVRVNGEWKRVAVRHSIDYQLSGTTASVQKVTFTFPQEKVTSLRVTANRAATRDYNQTTNSYNFRLMEIETYHDPNLAVYTGLETTETDAYKLPQVTDYDFVVDGCTDLTDLAVVRKDILQRNGVYYDFNQDGTVDVLDAVIFRILISKYTED